ncbi:MAG: outer membrane beta-barrel protein [Flavobacteriales bacterium]|nr:outer membrane beta-barrel protein [Flavobacteriales bacterium]
MKRILTLILSILTISAIGQEEADTSSVTIGAYADGYYAYYNNAQNVAIQQHNSIGAYHNNLGLNTAQITSSFLTKHFRGTITIHHGDIAEIAWGDKYREVQEGNIGVQITDGLWLDGGYFKTHVGTESFLPKDNLMSIITLGTFYGPFYQSGLRLSYDKGPMHYEAHLINGYNLHVDNNPEKSVGLLVSYAMSDENSVTYSTLYGSEQTGALDNDNLWYQNIYFNHSGEKLEVQAGLDVAFASRGTQSLKAGGKPLVTGLITAKYHVSDAFAVSARGEYFSDPSNINSFAFVPYYDASIDSSAVFQRGGINPGLNVFGVTAGLEYSPLSNGYLRLEARYLNDMNGDAGIGVKDDLSGFNAAVVGFNPHVTERWEVVVTAGFYFDKTFTFAR